MDATADKMGNRRGTVLAGTVAVTTIGAVFVFARIVTRLMMLRSFGWDDGLLLLAWVCYRKFLPRWPFTHSHHIDPGPWLILLHLLWDLQRNWITFGDDTTRMGARSTTVDLRMFCSLCMILS
jgi:hypothetical protein